MTTINGAGFHNVDDILASIRTSIREEGTSARQMSGEIHTPQGRREPYVAEEASDFELPAIFKPGHQSSPEKQKLLGRLSDALKATNPAEPGHARTVIPFEPNTARGFDAPARMMAAQASADRSYRPPQHTEPVHQPEPVRAPEPEEVKRIMPTFFDTRISKLGEMSRKAFEPEPAPKPAPQPRPVQRAPEPVPPALPPLQFRTHPLLPEGNLAHHQGQGVEDAAAQLLRPMLRQWLTENMPKIVEKALRSEAEAEMPEVRRKPGT